MNKLYSHSVQWEQWQIHVSRRQWTWVLRNRSEIRRTHRSINISQRRSPIRCLILWAKCQRTTLAASWLPPAQWLHLWINLGSLATIIKHPVIWDTKRVLNLRSNHSYSSLWRVNSMGSFQRIWRLTPSPLLASSLQVCTHSRQIKNQKQNQLPSPWINQWLPQLSSLELKRRHLCKENKLRRLTSLGLEGTKSINSICASGQQKKGELITEVQYLRVFLYLKHKAICSIDRKTQNRPQCDNHTQAWITELVQWFLASKTSWITPSTTANIWGLRVRICEK